MGLTGALQCYSHTTKYIDAWELLAPGLVLMSLHMPTGESTATPPTTSPTALALTGSSKQPTQPAQAWLGSAPIALAAKSSGSLAAQLLHAHNGGGAAAATAGAARGGAPRRSAAIAAASVVAAASQPRSGGSGRDAAAPEDDSDYEDYGNDGIGGAGEAKADNGIGSKRVRSEASKALGRPPGTVRKEDEVKRSHKAARLSSGGALVSNMRRLVGSAARDQVCEFSETGSEVSGSL